MSQSQTTTLVSKPQLHFCHLISLFRTLTHALSSPPEASFSLPLSLLLSPRYPTDLAAPSWSNCIFRMPMPNPNSNHRWVWVLRSRFRSESRRPSVHPASLSACCTVSLPATAQMPLLYLPRLQLCCTHSTPYVSRLGQNT